MTSSEEKPEYRFSGWTDMGIDEVPFDKVQLVSDPAPGFSDYVYIWGDTPDTYRRIPRAEYEAEYGPLIVINSGKKKSKKAELDPLAEAQINMDRAFAIADQIVAILTEEHMSAHTAADPRSTKAPEIEGAAADIATFYRYLVNHGVDKDTARALTIQYQDDQMVQAAQVREGIARPTPVTPVAEALTEKA